MTSLSNVIEVFNVDGTMQSVSLHAEVRADEVIGAIARRHNTDPNKLPFYSLFLLTVSNSEGVDLKRLNPDDRPLKIFAVAISHVPEDKNPTRKFAFAFLDADGERLFMEKGRMIIERPQTAVDRRPKQHGSSQQVTGFAPINSLGKGDKSGFLFLRSAANPREWQRRWCILRRNELVHCLSNTDHGDAIYIKLTQNNVAPIRDLDGLRHCFEIDTPRDVWHFRAKTEEEVTLWVAIIKRNILLASENEKFHLAERMIEDGQRQICSRDEKILIRSMASLEGLLSTHAGADRLYRFAKRSALGQKNSIDAALVSFYLDLMKANINLPLESAPTDPRYSRGVSLVSKLRVNDGASISSTGSSTSLQALRGSTTMLTRKEWMIQICDKVIEIFNSNSNDEITDLVRASESLRREIADENFDSIPRESCLILIGDASQIVLNEISVHLYPKFVASSEYSRIIASIPSLSR